jgi:lipopolysaccharide transport system ATP-binding protein
VNEPVLAVRALGKAFREYKSEWQRFASWLGFEIRGKSEKWVLRDISFRVAAGESIGIVGQNGAGKSTLLKLITGTLKGTTGTLVVNGRVAAILELGMGFNPDLSGRENVYHSAGLMGFSRGAIHEVIGDIEAFAEIGDYFDEPVRTYSSGMQMRVAFSVATAFRPEILIVDEALSVGDTYFVHKCFDRIREFRDAGTTFIIVSHDPGAIQSLCDRAIVIESGRLILDAAPKEAIDFYNALISEKEKGTIRQFSNERGGVVTESGTNEVTILEVQLLSAEHRPTEYLVVGEAVSLRVSVDVKFDIDKLVFGYMIRDRLGQVVFGTNTHHTMQVVCDVVAGESLVFTADFVATLGPGSYSVSIALTDGQDHLNKNYQWRDMALVFTVANVDNPYFIGSTWLPPLISVARYASASHKVPGNFFASH